MRLANRWKLATFASTTAGAVVGLIATTTSDGERFVISVVVGLIWAVCGFLAFTWPLIIKRVSKASDEEAITTEALWPQNAPEDQAKWKHFAQDELSVAQGWLIVM